MTGNPWDPLGHDGSGEKGFMATNDRSSLTDSNSRSAQGEVGFVVHPTWRLRGDIPEIHLYGRLDSGDSFLAIDTRALPSFYLRVSDATRAADIAVRHGGTVTPSARRTLDGEEVVAIVVRAPNRLGALRHALEEVEIRTYEADVPFAWAYLIDRHIRGSINIQGPWQRGDFVDRVYTDPTLEASEAEPKLISACVSLDQHPQTGAIQDIAMAGFGSQAAQDVRIRYTLAGRDGEPADAVCRTERDLLVAFRDALCRLDPDIIVGWDVGSLVLVALKQRMTACGIPFNLGRSNRLSHVVLPPDASKGQRHDGSQAIVEGRQILDAARIVLSGQRRFEDVELASISRELLGRIPNSVSERVQAVLDILETDNLIQLTVRRSLLIGIPLQRAWTSVQAFDFLYLSELHARGMVAPTRDTDRRGGSPAPGGLILSPRAGTARNVLVLDFKSLYPSIIRTFNIDPVTQISDPADGQDAILAPNGAAFTRESGILPKILDRFFESRAAAKTRGDDVASYAYKIIMNSFYGVLGTSSCRFASQSISGAITSFGQQLLRWTRDTLQGEGLTVIYGDTDSLFIDAGASFARSAEEATQRGQAIAARINEQLRNYLAVTYGVVSRLELEMEKVYTRFFLPTVRGEQRGRAKGYAGLIVDRQGERVDVVGMEAVRRDWTPLARRFQRELLDLAFHDASEQAIEAYVVRTLQQLRRGELDAELVYLKSLRKPLSEYTKTQPPHVQAAALLPEKKAPGDVIRYVITLQGPQPEDYIQAPIDYAHIIQKQLQPIADSLSGLIALPRYLFGSGQIGLF